ATVNKAPVKTSARRAARSDARDLRSLELETANCAVEELRDQLALAARRAADAELLTCRAGTPSEPDPTAAVALDHDRPPEQPEPAEQHRTFSFRHQLSRHAPHLSLAAGDSARPPSMALGGPLDPSPGGG